MSWRLEEAGQGLERPGCHLIHLLGYGAALASLDVFDPEDLLGLVRSLFALRGLVQTDHIFNPFELLEYCDLFFSRDLGDW